MFQPMVGFKANLRTRLGPDDAVLPLTASEIARLAQLLTEANDYTRLWIGDGVNHEIVRVTGVVGGAVVIERGDEGTQAITSPAGACVPFASTPQNLSHFIQQRLGAIRPAVCSGTAASGRVQVASDACAVTVDLPACEGATWRAGNEQFTQGEDGCIGVQPVTPPLVDGEYLNATVTVQGGHIVAIRSGTNIVYSGGGCCCCGNEP